MSSNKLLAKPDKVLVEHLSEVTALGAQIAERLMLSEPLRVKVILACALHDIGKATVDFQEYIRGRRQKAYPHALASLPFVLCAETSLAEPYTWERRSLEATAAVLTHHSPLSPNLFKDRGTVDYHSQVGRVLEEVWQLLQSHGIRSLPPVGAFWENVQRLLTVPLASLLDDSLSFNDKNSTLRGLLRDLPPQNFACVKTALHLADWLASAKVMQTSVLFLQDGISAVNGHADTLNAPLRIFQTEAQQARHSDVLWLRAPTGTGKTEALLLWAGDTERLLYLLPTQATTNAMWRRLRRIYGHETVALAHGRAFYTLRQEPDEGPLDARLFGSVFARPVTVATLDQYLLAHLHGRYWEERRTLASRATVVLDELHAYEPYTLGLLLEALKRECPARLALAGATLPDSLLALFPEGRLIEAEPDLWHRSRHVLAYKGEKLLESGVEEALEHARRGKRVLAIANTVRDAQELYRLLQQAGWKKCVLLHARFILRDRVAKEEEIGRAESGTVFIATQVVEVSLDISYDVLITEIAPVDALVQRMGRVNRRGEQTTPAPVVIYTQWSDGSQRVYGKEVLTWSKEILTSLSFTPTDRDLAQATQRLYEQVVATEEWQRELAQGRTTLDDLQRSLGCYTIDFSDEELHSRFATRRGTVSVEVLPALFEEEAWAFKEQGELWKLPELLVPVPIWWVREFADRFLPLPDLGALQTTLTYDGESGLHSPSTAL